MRTRWIRSITMMVLLLGAAAQAATNIVNFAHGVGTVNAGTADNISSNGYIWTFSDSGTPLLEATTNPANTNGTIYGGLNVTWDDPNTNYSPTVQLNGNTDVFYIQNNAKTSTQRNRGLLVWNRADFLNHSTNDYVVFDAESSMSVDVPLEGGTTRVRFLVNDGGDYYVSSNVLSNVGTLTLDDPGATQWAPIATEGSYVYGAFTKQTFYDIQGVGLYIDQSTANQARLQISGFQVSATTTTNAPPPTPPKTIIDFTHLAGTGNARAADNVSTNGNTWNFSDSTVLLSNSEGAGESNTQIYGGMQTFWAPTNHNPVFALRADPGRVQIQVNPLSDGLKGLDSILLWNKADFLNHSTSDYVVFDGASSMSLATTQKAGTTTLRFVVKDGDDYYVSSTTTNNIGTLTLNDPGAEPWAVIDPTDYSIGAYAAQTFGDIQAVGVYIRQTRTGTGQTLLKLTDFQVTANTTTNPPPEKSYGIINFTYDVGGSPSARTPDSTNSTSSTWDFSESTLLWDGSDAGINNNTDIYGGMQAFWPDGEASTHVYQLNQNDKAIKIQIKTDGTAGDRGI